MFDMEDTDSNIIPGQWKQNYNADDLIDLERRPRNAYVLAKLNRNQFVHYCMSERGCIPWQSAYYGQVPTFFIKIDVLTLVLPFLVLSQLLWCLLKNQTFKSNSIAFWKIITATFFYFFTFFTAPSSISLLRCCNNA